MDINEELRAEIYKRKWHKTIRRHWIWKTGNRVEMDRYQIGLSLFLIVGLQNLWRKRSTIGCVTIRIIIIIIIIIFLLLSQFFLFLVLLLLNQWWAPTLRLLVSDCSTFLAMLLVQLFLVENLLKAFLVLFSDIFSPLLTIPVAPIIIIIIISWLPPTRPVLIQK
jgi:hypothetical protein